MPQLLTTYLRKLKASWLERRVPNISEENAEFIKNLIREKNPKHILEIGTANGYSTIQFASVLSSPLLGETERGTSPNPSYKEGNVPTITTIEYAWNAHIEAVEHFKNCKLHNIHSIWWDAKRVLPTLRLEFFDLVYIDAMKREYLDYLVLALPLMKSDALIIIDDVEKFRDKMKNLYTWLEDNHIPYQLEKTDIDDSIMIIERHNIQV